MPGDMGVTEPSYVEQGLLGDLGHVPPPLPHGEDRVISQQLTLQPQGSL